MSSAPVWCVLLAAGRGERLGRPKQFAHAAGARLVEHALLAARAGCDGVVVVLPAPAGAHGVAHPHVVDGGATRAQSVRAGLAAVPADAGIVVVADAAHPLASAALHRAVAEAVRSGADGAVPGLPVNEVLTRVEHLGASGTVSSGTVSSGTVSRAGLVLTQTPQAFRAELLRALHAGEPEVVDDSTLVLGSGGRVVVVPGEPANLHVTTQAELDLAAALLAAPYGHIRLLRGVEEDIQGEAP